MEESIVPGRSTGDIRTISHGGSKSQFPYEIQTTLLKQRDFKNVEKGFSWCLLLEELLPSLQYKQA